jgi:hypothetical protein
LPIDTELKDGVHQSIVRHFQQLSVESQLLSLLTELSDQEISEDRRMQRISLLQTELDITKDRGSRDGN